MVITFADHVPVTPPGNPVILAPVAPVVVKVILVIEVPEQIVWTSVPVAELKAIVFWFTIKFPVAVITPHPPTVVTV